MYVLCQGQECQILMNKKKKKCGKQTCIWPKSTLWTKLTESTFSYVFCVKQMYSNNLIHVMCIEDFKLVCF